MKFIRGTTLAFTAGLALTVSACAEMSDLLNPHRDPSTPEEALKALPLEAQAQLTTWARSLEKSCHASDVISKSGTAPSGERQIDINQLILRNRGSLAFVDGSDFALLGSPQSFSGTHESRAVIKTVFNGIPRDAEVRTRQVGSRCEVFLFGRKVFTTQLASTIPIIASSSAQAELNTTAPSNVEFDATSTPITGSIAGEGILEAIQIGLRPRTEDSSLLARTLNLDSESAKRYFPASEDLGLAHSFQILTPSVVLPFNSEDARLIGTRSALTAFASATALIKVRARLKPPHGFATPNDRGTWMVEMSVQPTITEGTLKTYQMVSARFAGVLPYDATTAVSCFRDRLTTLQALLPTTDFEFKPSLSEVEGPCVALVDDLRSTLFEDPTVRSDIAQLFSQVRPSDIFNYAGWETLLSLWIKRALRSDIDANEMLNPQGISPLIGEAIRATREVQSRLDRAPAMKAVLTSESLGSSWALKGLSVSFSQLERIMFSLNNAADVLPEATVLLLESLKKNPTAGGEALQYAGDLSAADQEMIHEIRKLARAVEAEDLINDRLTRLLETRPSRATLASWLQTLQATKDFAERDRMRAAGGVSDTHQRAKQALIRQAIDENWTSENFMMTDEVAQLGRAYLSCVNHTDTSRVVECAGANRFSTRPGSFFHADFGGRYIELARTLEVVLSRVRLQKGLSLTELIAGEFYRVMWRECDSTNFSERSQSLLAKLDTWLKDSTPWRRTEIESEVQELVGSTCIN